MLQKFTMMITPVPIDGKITRNPYGKHIHALLFYLLDTIDPRLAVSVHSAQEKPFSMWYEVSADSRVTVILAVFEKSMCQALQQLAKQQEIFCTLDTYQAVVDFSANKAFTMNKLWEDAGEQQHSGKLRINFLKPTSFRSSGVQLLFPEPRLIFKSVYAKALIYGGEYLVANLSSSEEFNAQIYISRYELATREVNYGKYKIIGCMGYAVYDYRQVKVSYLQHSLAFLSALSEYTGIGYKTTMGLGRVVCTLGG